MIHDEKTSETNRNQQKPMEQGEMYEYMLHLTEKCLYNLLFLKIEV